VKFAVRSNGAILAASEIARCWRKTTYFTRFSRTITPEIDRHFADIKVFHHPSRKALCADMPSGSQIIIVSFTLQLLSAAELICLSDDHGVLQKV
jgi:hypothetical protein